MEPTIRPFDPDDRDAAVVLSLRTWAPAFASMKDVMGPAVYEAVHEAVYEAQYPSGWREPQRVAVGRYFKALQPRP